jgi:glycosyltransferase involved in cell wall biosynthesis
MNTPLLQSAAWSRTQARAKAHSAAASGRELAAPARKRVLLIAFDFPPRRTSGVYRPTAFAKYLPRYGWQPTILTIRNKSAVEDPTLLEKIPPETEVVRTYYLAISSWEDGLHARLRSLGLLRPAAGQEITGKAATNGDSTHRLGDGADSLGLTLRSIAAALRAVFYFPDESAGWIPVAAARSVNLMLRKRFDAVYTTHPPRSAHIVGLLLKQLCRVPWIAEFRDPWVLPENEEPIFAGQVTARHRNKWLQGAVLRRADAIVTVTSRHAQELQEHFGVPPEKLAVVTNGFDEDDFRCLDVSGRSRICGQDRIDLCHLGTIYGNFSGQFFTAVAELVRAQPELQNLLRVHVIGYPDATARRFAEGDLRSVVRVHGFVEHTEALRVMHDCDALLLFYGHQYTSRASVPGKLYEYLRTGRPILAIAYPGGVDELIRGAGAGWVLDPDDVTGIKETLNMIIAERLGGRPLPAANAGLVAQYRYDLLTKHVANLLDGVAAK